MWVMSYYKYFQVQNDGQFNVLASGVGDEEGNDVTFHQIIPTPIVGCDYKMVSDITNPGEDEEQGPSVSTLVWHEGAERHHWIKDCWFHKNDLYDTSVSDNYLIDVLPQRGNPYYNQGLVCAGWKQPGVWVAGTEEPVFIGYYTVYSHKQNGKYIRTGLPYLGTSPTTNNLNYYTYGVFRDNPYTGTQPFTTNIAEENYCYGQNGPYDIEWFDGTTGNWKSDSQGLPPISDTTPQGPQDNGAVIYSLYSHLNMNTEPSILL